VWGTVEWCGHPDLDSAAVTTATPAWLELPRWHVPEPAGRGKEGQYMLSTLGARVPRPPVAAPRSMMSPGTSRGFEPAKLWHLAKSSRASIIIQEEFELGVASTIQTGPPQSTTPRG